MKESDTILIVGAGITGLVVAKELSRKWGKRVLLVEKESFIGGLSATMKRNRLKFDFGSHRLHSDFPREAYTYLCDEVNVELMTKPRNGRLHFRGKSLQYPPKLLEVTQTMSFKECAKATGTFILSTLPSKKSVTNYEEKVVKSIGKTFYNIFYKEYAKKLWGMHPQEISVDAYNRRKTFGDLKSIYRIVTGKTKSFLYPRTGIGEIPEKIHSQVEQNEGRVYTGCTLSHMHVKGKKIEGVTLKHASGTSETVSISNIISTIPIDTLYKVLHGTDDAKEPLSWRGLKILYIHFDETLQLENETFYFSSRDYLIGRVSNISMYSEYVHDDTKGTLLTVEIPVSPHNSVWDMSDKELLSICLDELQRCGILPDEHRVLDYFSMKHEKTYPIYKKEWSTLFDSYYNSLNHYENLYLIGRNSLFLHCNIDHCITQALELSRHLLSENESKEQWLQRADAYFKHHARD